MSALKAATDEAKIASHGFVAFIRQTFSGAKKGVQIGALTGATASAVAIMSTKGSTALDATLGRIGLGENRGRLENLTKATGVAAIALATVGGAIGAIRAIRQTMHAHKEAAAIRRTEDARIAQQSQRADLVSTMDLS